MKKKGPKGSSTSVTEADDYKYRFAADLPRASQEQQIMRDLFNTNDKVNKLAKFKPPNLRSMYDRRKMLRDRIQGGVDDQSLIMKGIVDPLTIPRIETALNQIEDFAVLTEGAKPQTELDKSRIAMKFLDLCEKPETFKFYGRFDQGYEAKLTDRNTSKEYQRAQ